MNDHRSRLYERYITHQVGIDLNGLRKSLERPQPYLERLIDQHFPTDKSAKIIDLGCGHGLLLHALRQRGYTDIVGVETSAEQVEAAHTLGLNMVRQGDLMQTLRTAAAGSFDVIVAFDVLEHFTKDEVLDIVELIFSRLAPGGTMIIHVPNGEAIFAGKILFGDFTHQIAFTTKSVRQIASYAGFDEIHCYEDAPVAHGALSAIRAVGWRLVRTGFRIVNMVETGDVGHNLVLSQNLLAVCKKGR